MSKKKINLKPKVNPIIASLPEHLKNPANYQKIQKAILETFISTCGHSDMMEWAKCKICTAKMLDRRHLLKKLGFKHPAQYMAWKKIHETIATRFPLVDWEKNKLIV